MDHTPDCEVNWGGDCNCRVVFLYDEGMQWYRVPVNEVDRFHELLGGDWSHFEEEFSGYACKAPSNYSVIAPRER